MTLQIGQILDGKYRIIRELGSGSMGAVYEGENVRIRRHVAIKVLLSGMARRSDSVQRFEREAQAAGRIGSDHIVEVLDLGTLPDGGFFMVMEFLDGLTLADHIHSHGRLAPRAIAPLIQQLLTGLEMAHEARVIHRDLKPDNIFLMAEHAGQKNFVKILDFGVSKFNPLNAEEGMSMTRTGVVVGTPFYMAPEQAKGSRDIDHRSDLYSVGVILYEAVTGQKPFHAGTFNELIFKIVLETPPPPEQFVPDLDPAFARIIRRAMARELDERFQTAGEFRDALSIWLHTGRDGNKAAATLPLPPGDFALDEDNCATIMMDPQERASGRLATDRQPGMAAGNHAQNNPSQQPLAPHQTIAQHPLGQVGTPVRANDAVFSNGGGGLLPSPTASHLAADASGAAGAHEHQPQTALPYEASRRLPASSATATTAPAGRMLPPHAPSAAVDHAAAHQPVMQAAGVPPKRNPRLLWAIAGMSLLLAGGVASAYLLLAPVSPSRPSAVSVVDGDDRAAALPSAAAVSSAKAIVAAPPKVSADGMPDAPPTATNSGAAATSGDTPAASALTPEATAPPQQKPLAKPTPSWPVAAPKSNHRTTQKPAVPAPQPAAQPVPNGGRTIKVEL